MDVFCHKACHLILPITLDSRRGCNQVVVQCEMVAEEWHIIRLELQKQFLDIQICFSSSLEDRGERELKFLESSGF